MAPAPLRRPRRVLLPYRLWSACFPSGSNRRWCFGAPGSDYLSGSQHHVLATSWLSARLVLPYALAPRPFPRKSPPERGSSGFDGDLVAEPLKAADRVAQGRLPVAFVEVVPAELLVGNAVAEQMVGDHQDGVGQGDQRPLG